MPPISQATHLVQLSEGRFTFFHTPADEPMAKFITASGGRENLVMRTKAFRARMGQIFYEWFHKIPGNQAIEDALNTLMGKALNDSPEEPVHMRVAMERGVLYIDLGDPELSIVKVDNTGWDVISNPPDTINFIRPKSYQALPTPDKNSSVAMGSLEKALSPFVNIKDEHWILLIGWVLGAYAPFGPYPVLSIHGEQGAAKTTLARVLKRLTDPSSAPVRANPGGVRDLMIAARGQRVLAFDNVSEVKDWLSDAICQLATGGGYATRKLYADDEEMILDSINPVILNGINTAVSRGDLVDRTIHIEALPIEEDKRKLEQEFWPSFNNAAPGIMAIILDVLTGILENRNKIQIKKLPRMADFALWVTAGEETLGWNPGSFIKAYNENREELESELLDTNTLAEAVFDLLANQPSWKGSATVLFNILTTNNPNVLYKTPANLSKELKRLAPSLRRNGVKFENQRDYDPVTKKMVRYVLLEKI
jgi:hypothetical protein